jgi:hypothetical protein
LPKKVESALANCLIPQIFNMPKINLSLPHKLGAEEAKKRVNHLIAETRVKFADLISNVEESWNGNVETFQFKVKGLSVNGMIEARDDAVIIQMQLPFAALPFKNKVESDLLKHARELLA